MTRALKRRPQKGDRTALLLAGHDLGEGDTRATSMQTWDTIPNPRFVLCDRQ
jgi:hypothetical protein